MCGRGPVAPGKQGGGNVVSMVCREGGREGEREREREGEREGERERGSEGATTLPVRSAGWR